jgi:hypothetical protein
LCARCWTAPASRRHADPPSLESRPLSRADRFAGAAAIDDVRAFPLAILSLSRHHGTHPRIPQSHAFSRQGLLVTHTRGELGHWCRRAVPHHLERGSHRDSPPVHICPSTPPPGQIPIFTAKPVHARAQVSENAGVDTPVLVVVSPHLARVAPCTLRRERPSCLGARASSQAGARLCS